MVSPENEIVPLTHTLFATENIEGWLNELEASMFESVYDKTKLCVEKYRGLNNQEKTDDQVMWAQFVERPLMI